MDSGDPKRVVEEGYDRIADAYLAWSNQGVRAAEREKYTRLLLERVPAGERVLDLGCGSGLPTTCLLADHYQVIGVDISARQIDLARQNVPGAEFIHADITTLDFPPGYFGGIAAFYSLIHIPRSEYPALFTRLAVWLRPGGLLVASLGSRAVEHDYGEDFLGAPMYWSSDDPAAHHSMLEAAGLVVLSSQEETELEFGEPVTFQWVIAQR